MKKVALLILVIIISIPLSAQNEIWNKLDKGNYEVGFKVFSLYDSSRKINDGKDYSPVQVSAWYPAKVTNESSLMTYRDYFVERGRNQL